MILDMYKDCFNIIYIFRPSIDVDSIGIPMKTLKNIKVEHTDDDQIYFDHYDAEALHEILDTQHKITEYTKKKFKKLY